MVKHELNQPDMERELANLKNEYRLRLESLAERAKFAIALVDRSVSTHDAFNMSATCQELAVLAGKIEQTVNVLRWMAT
jgi:hypothetical protein